MTPEREGYVRAMMEVAEDFSDGAYFGFLTVECGIEVEELLELQEMDAPTPTGGTKDE